ncbi:MAG TPA: hypothetical protein VFA66_06915 [Gaiellaceae bacterium]|nr:hypothetical protein [Gaiellaceae bacterium]
MKRLVPVGIGAAASLAVAAGLAAAALPQDMPKSYLLSGPGRVTPLRSGVTYHASLFPLAVRATPPEAGWSGAQWKSTSAYFSDTGGPPYFGWAAFAGGSPRSIPQGLVTIVTAYDRTPSVAATVETLRTRGRGATYGASAPVKVAGFSGVQFDGRIVGARREHIGHFFVPFSPPSSAAKYYPDEYPVYGDVFRVIVLDVRGKTVVAIVENVALPAERFPAFLERAGRLLQSLRFPAGKGA